MVYTLRFFFSLKCSLFHNSNLFGSCIIHNLYTEWAKIKKNNSGAKRLNCVIHKKRRVWSWETTTGLTGDDGYGDCSHTTKSSHLSHVAYVTFERCAIIIALCRKQICGRPLALQEKWHNLAAVGDPRALWMSCTSVCSIPAKCKFNSQAKHLTLCRCRQWHCAEHSTQANICFLGSDKFLMLSVWLTGTSVLV